MNIKEDVSENIVKNINLILLNIPENITDLEKLRWLYIKLGNLFCYDFRIMVDKSLMDRKVDFNRIGRYQTCIQISEIFNIVLSNLNSNVSAKVIPRLTNDRAVRGGEHVANVVSFTDEVTNIHYDLLLDLTLDLYRIQAGMQTGQFAYTTDMNSTYDIISLAECAQMDSKLNLTYGKYTNQKIDEVKEILQKSSLSLKEQINYMWESLGKKFAGIHEAQLYLSELFMQILPQVQIKKYNLSYGTVSDLDVVVLFEIRDNGTSTYILFDNMDGLIPTSLNNVKAMLKAGWKTNSDSLNAKMEEPEERKQTNGFYK